MQFTIFMNDQFSTFCNGDGMLLPALIYLHNIPQVFTQLSSFRFSFKCYFRLTLFPVDTFLVQFFPTWNSLAFLSLKLMYMQKLEFQKFCYNFSLKSSCQDRKNKIAWKYNDQTRQRLIFPMCQLECVLSCLSYVPL